MNKFIKPARLAGKEPITRIFVFLSLSLALFLTASARAFNPPPIIITEIAAFEKQDYEWIEIYNRSEQAVDLIDWTFWEGITASNPSGTNHKITVNQGDYILVSKEYAIIVQNAEKFKTAHQEFSGTLFDSSWSSLNESGEQIGLKDKDKNIVESFTYISASNASLERIALSLDDYSENNWQEREIGDSAGKENDGYLILKTNQNSNISEQSNINTNTEAENNNTIDNTSKNTFDNSNVLNNNTEVTNENNFNEETEFCEIKAHAGSDIITRIGEEILFDGSLSVILGVQASDEVSYSWNFDDGEQAEGLKVYHSYQTEGDYHPFLIIKACDLEDKSKIRATVLADNDLDTETTQVSGKPGLANNSETTELTFQENSLTIAEAKKMPAGVKATLQGIVIIEPQIFSKNYFYIIDDSGTGIQIYSYYSDWPDLRVGHLIEASGELSQVYQEKRLKIKNKNDLKFLIVQDPPEPKIKKIIELSKTLAGDFIEVQAEIVEIKSDEIFIQDDAGELKIVIKEKTGIDKSIFLVNEQIKAAGILTLTQGGLRLLPRFNGDLQKIEREASQVLGEVISEDVSQKEAQSKINFADSNVQEIVIPSHQNRSGQIVKYLLPLIITAGVIVTGLIVKKYRVLKE